MNIKKLFFSFLTVAFLSGLFFSSPVLADKEGCEPKPITNYFQCICDWTR